MNEYELKALGTKSRTTRELRELLQLAGMTTRNVAAFTATTKTQVSRLSRGDDVSVKAFLALSYWVEDHRYLLDERGDK